jgi:2-amino-4-hydroxy-6-hydroxymethyldihydropteridine diphosphokinase
VSLAYVGVGANLGDARATVARALDDLVALWPGRASSLYRTEPLGPPDQPWYVNAVAEIRTALEPLELLGALRELERAAGRDRSRGRRWGPRELDLDLLLVGDRVLDTPELVLPHPGLALRRFVLEPLAELAPSARDPRSGTTAAELLVALDDPLRVEKLPTPASPGSGDDP